MQESDIYDIDAIEKEVRERFAERKDDDMSTSWLPKGHFTPRFTRTERSFTVAQNGFLPSELNFMEVNANGFCEIHWSIPFGIMLEGIVKRHNSKLSEDVVSDDEE